MASNLVQAIKRRCFSGRPNDWQLYHEMVRGFLRPGMTVVEIGCGRGRIAPFGWEAHPEVTLIGLDPDPSAAENLHLARFEQLSPGAPWPLADGSADLVLARYVLEHVEQPDDFLANAARVLKPGCPLIFLTPNRRHPAILASRLMPLALHRRILSRTRMFDPSDVFPTFYRMNNAGRIRRLAAEAGLTTRTLLVRELEPVGYLEFALIPWLFALAYYAAATATRLDRWFGLTMIGILEKPAHNSRGRPD